MYICKKNVSQLAYSRKWVEHKWMLYKFNLLNLKLSSDDLSIPYNNIVYVASLASYAVNIDACINMTWQIMLKFLLFPFILFSSFYLCFLLYNPFFLHNLTLINQLLLDSIGLNKDNIMALYIITNLRVWLFLVWLLRHNNYLGEKYGAECRLNQANVDSCTRPKIRFPTCPVSQTWYFLTFPNISWTRIGQHFMQINEN